MTVALILIASLVAVGLLLWLAERRWRAKNAHVEESAPQQTEEECCGMHITCERDSLLAAVSKEIEYYEDEHLDAYAGRAADDYEDCEIEEFRDVMLTMRVDEIAGWARSLQPGASRCPKLSERN